MNYLINHQNETETGNNHKFLLLWVLIMRIESLKGIYQNIKPQIANRIQEFKIVWDNADDKKLFVELAFCIFTPQSSARSCWKAVQLLLDKNLMFNGTAEQISMEINIVRFRNNKARYLVEAREKLTGKNRISLKETINSFSDVKARREWIVQNIKGIGYKESSHFLRNIGLGQDIAILDRHILKNMVHFGIIDRIPGTISPKKYIELEELLREFSIKVEIPMEHLDFVLWYMEAGEVFK